MPESFSTVDPKDSENNLQLPSIWEQAKSVTKATIAHVKSGMDEVSPEERQIRLDICGGCQFFLKDQNRCGRCGCALAIKSRWSSSTCPIGLWGPK